MKAPAAAAGTAIRNQTGGRNAPSLGAMAISAATPAAHDSIEVRESLNTNSPTLLMTTGILDAIAAGALIFLALGDMNACKTQAEWLREQKVGIQLVCFASFFLGAAALLVIALWA